MPPWACLMTCVSTESEAKGFARQWVAARNSHDLDAIMWHYDVDVVLISPVTAKILDDQSGTVEGKGALPGAVGLPVEQRVAMTVKSHATVSSRTSPGVTEVGAVNGLIPTSHKGQS